MALQTDNNTLTANNVLVYANGQLLGLAQNITCARSTSPAPQYQIGTPLYADAPVSRALVNVTVTGLVPREGAGGTSQPWSDLGLSPTAGLEEQVTAPTFTMQVVSQDTYQTLWAVLKCRFSNDSVQINETAPVSYNLSLIAQNTSVWT